jgi:hypothetical protein
MQKGKNTTAWGSSSREARTGLLLPTHSAEKAEWMGHGAIAWSRRSRGSHHCVGQQLAGLAPLRGAAARGRLALAYCFPPIPQKSGMDGARSFMRCEMEIGGGADEFW